MLPEDLLKYLNAIREDERRETVDLEFKQELPKKTDGSRKEFAKDVSAMANSEGGDIIFGIKEGEGKEEGVAKEIAPLLLEETSRDAVERQLRDILKDWIEPRLSGVQYHWTSVEGGHALMVRVPQSFAGPHCYGKKENMRFVMRDGAGTKYLSYEELRRFFDRSGTLLKMAHDFRTERLEKIKRGEVWSPMSEGPYCVLHWIPLSAMTGQHEIDIHDLMRSGNYNKFVLMKGSQSSRPNLDGFRLVEGSGLDSVSSGRVPGRPEVEHFRRLFWNAQIFRSGALEMAFAVLFDSVEEENRKLIPQGWFVQELRKAMVGFKDGMLSLGISGPMVVGVSILFTQDFEFWARGIRSFVIPQSDRENLILPEEWVENLEAIENIDEIARPILDTLWQCFGLPRCEYYDEDGKWNPPQ